MNKEQTIYVLEHLKGTKVGVNMDPQKAWQSWSRKLEMYTEDEVWDALTYLEDNTAPEKHRLVFGDATAIRAACDRFRHAREKAEKDRQDKEWIRNANESFRNIPGENRTEQVIYIQAQRSAEHWRNGETDNDYYNYKLEQAQELGFEFEGVDYTKIENSGKKLEERFSLPF